MAIGIRTATPPPNRRGATLADLLALPGDGPRFELLGGELVLMPPPDVAHMLIIQQLLRLVFAAEDAGYGVAGSAPCAVALDYLQRGLRGIDGPEPDVFFVRQEHAQSLQGDFVPEVPGLVIEVLSPTTRKNDLPGGSKWLAYERNGVPYYWIVDPEARTVTQYSHRDSKFVAEAVLSPGALLACPLFPGITRDVADLFRTVRER